jgi:hypothetical protein
LKTPAPPKEIQELELIGYLGYGENWALSVQGDYAYLGANLELVILDISRSARPERLGHIILPGPITAIALSGAYAYVTTGQGAGLFVVDVSEPAAPFLLSTRYTGHPLSDVVVSGELAIVTGAALHLLDISDPSVPVEVGSHTFPLGQTGSKKTAVAGRYAFALFHDSKGRAGGFQIIDISDPAAAEVVGTFAGDFIIYQILPVADYVYLLVGGSGEKPHVTMVDISDPAQPFEIGLGHPSLWQAKSMAVVDQHLYLADPNETGVSCCLRLFDIADPMRPELISDFHGGIGPVQSMLARDGLVYVVGGDGLSIVDFSEPTTPSKVGFYQVGRLPDFGRDVLVSGKYAYIAAGRAGLLVVNINDPANPSIVSHHDTAGVAWDLALDGEFVYVADEYNGLRVIDVSNPLNPVGVGVYYLPEQLEFFHSVTVVDGYAYVADGSFEVGQMGLHVVDVSDPIRPAAAGYLPLDISAQEKRFARIEDVAVANGYAYLAAGGAGLRVIDVTEPERPVEVGVYETPGRADNLAVTGRHLFLADGDLRIVDRFDPAAPALVGFLDLPDFSTTPQVAVQGNFAYVASSGVQILDISTPNELVVVADHPFVSGSLAVAGEMVYAVGDGFFVLRSR